jgi:hypothetical protein
LFVRKDENVFIGFKTLFKQRLSDFYRLKSDIYICRKSFREREHYDAFNKIANGVIVNRVLGSGTLYRSFHLALLNAE